MKQQYEHTFIYFLLVYIVKLTYKDEYNLFSFIVEIKIYCVSNTTFLIHHFQFLTNAPFKKLDK